MTPEDVYKKLVNKEYAVPDDIWKAAFPGKGMGTPASKKLYLDEQNRWREIFKSDLERAYGLTNYPKRDAVFEIAWEDGNGSLYTTYLQYGRFVSLIVV